MQNIELFDQYVALILSQLYESFPVKRGLETRQLTGHTESNEYGAICAPDGRPSKEVEVAYATIEWLAETGYIRTESSRHLFGCSGCVLTSLGLHLLKATPESVKVKEAIGDKLVRLVREGSIDLAKDAAKAIIALGARGVG